MAGLLDDYHDNDLADALELMTPEERHKLYDTLPAEDLADIFERLDQQFSFEQAMQHSVAVKGANVTQNCVQQMLKNWRRQGLIVQTEDANYRKT